MGVFRSGHGIQNIWNVPWMPRGVKLYTSGWQGSYLVSINFGCGGWNGSFINIYSNEGQVRRYIHMLNEAYKTIFFELLTGFHMNVSRNYFFGENLPSGYCAKRVSRSFSFHNSCNLPVTSYYWIAGWSSNAGFKNYFFSVEPPFRILRKRFSIYIFFPG